jgi:hypothetical protein
VLRHAVLSRYAALTQSAGSKTECSRTELAEDG